MDAEPAPPGGPRLGLALSGGGHRAAFFHIGVLGALAELGLLRQVRVLSTVSGGSLVGALYYLHLKSLLETIDDGEITDAHYVEIVHNVALEYREAVAKNLLARVYLNPWKNLKMASRRYSRTVRMGELLEKHFYRPAWNGELVGGQIPMRALRITPGSGSIDPDSNENARRNAPVPILLLESTSLNTGHNWRFEAKYMGEPDRQSDVIGDEAKSDPTDVDKNETLMRTPWEQLPESLRDFPLGQAVAASAAFPAGFTPIQIRDLYPGVVVALTDGGVHDNQGVEGLMDRRCTHIIISDGSGQMPDVDKPGTWVPAVLSRVVSVYSDAEREERLLRAFGDDKSAFFHLQSGLPNRVRLPGEETREPPARMTTSDFGVDPALQQHLARVRTNLDAFSELEAWSLAKDGHAIAGHITPLRPDINALARPMTGPTSWPWDDVDLKNPSSRLQSALANGSKGMLGLWVPLAAIALAAVASAGYFLSSNGWAVYGIAVGVVAVLVLYVIPVPVVSALLYEVVIPLVLAAPFLIAAFCLWRFEARRLRHARLDAG